MTAFVQIHSFNPLVRRKAMRLRGRINCLKVKKKRESQGQTIKESILTQTGIQITDCSRPLAPGTETFKKKANSDKEAY